MAVTRSAYKQKKTVSTTSTSSIDKSPTTTKDNDPIPSNPTPQTSILSSWTPAVWLQTISCVITLVCYLGYCALYSHDFLVQIRKMFNMVAVYSLFTAIYYYSNFHKHFGIWKCAEPKSHFNFALHSAWIVILFAIGEVSRKVYFHMEGHDILEVLLKHSNLTVSQIQRVVTYEVEDQYKFIKSHSLTEDIFWGVVGFYAIDFLRYWAHRLGHRSFFYKTFPFSHAHHHNQIFVNPMTTIMSPMLHLASLATYSPPFFLGIMGLHRSAAISLLICSFPNWTQHLGCDPLPWLTRLNHFYFYGALPWIPLYHSYHHNPFIKTGNFGNTTVFFDYMFGTLQPECIYHIEHGEAMEKVSKWFADEDKLDRILKSMYDSAGGKNRMDLHEKGYDFSEEMLSMHYL